MQFFIMLTEEFNPVMHNVQNWSDSKCWKIFKVRLTILGHYALKG